MPRRPADEDELFLQAMRNMGLAKSGVKAQVEEDLDFEAMLRESSGEVDPPSPARPPRQPGPQGKAGAKPDLAAEDALFDQAMAGCDFTAPPPAAAETADPAAVAPPAQGRARTHGSKRTLSRRIKVGTVVEERTLDLHGRSREQAWALINRFLARAREDGLDVVKVITGRGLHSIGDAVLLRAVGEWLDKPLREHVRDVVKAPKDKGGEGVRFVFLRPSAS